MSHDSGWEALLTPSADPEPGTPASRRELRERRRRPRRRWWQRAWLWVLLVLFGLGAGGAAWAWTNYEDRLRELLGWELPNDYEGDGNGTEVIVIVEEGDTGGDIASTLADQGVTMTAEAFYELALERNPVFTPGAYALQERMSAAAAMAVLSDPANRVILSVTLPEGITVRAMFERLSEGTGTPLADYEAAAADPAAFGLPAEAPSLEGYLFPATYQFDPGTPARDQIQHLVDTMTDRLDALGVTAGDRHRVLTIASLVQREARLPDDFARVSRVIQNRLAADMPLQFDSTSHYGYEWAHGSSSAGESVFTTDAERADDNPYNTYVHTGLPLGPISAPGDAALDAALHPADGDWVFFVTVNLETGETVFTSTAAEHERAVAQLREWCRTSEFDC